MAADVNPREPAGLSRAERTERKIVDAATKLFVAHGYRGTTLSQVAAAAGVSDRTIYVRFATKAELLNRVIGVAIVGDTLPIDLAHRDWVITARTAPTLEERLVAESSGSAQLMARTAPIVEVGLQAEPDEPLIAASAQAGRTDAYAQVRAFWEAAYADGLMHPKADLEWVINTTGLLANFETYLLMTRTIGWSPKEYERWRYRTWKHFATTPGPKL